MQLQYPKNTIWYIEASDTDESAPQCGSAVAVWLRNKHGSETGRRYLLTCGHVLRRNHDGPMLKRIYAWEPDGAYSLPQRISARVAHDVRDIDTDELSEAERTNPVDDWVILELQNAQASAAMDVIRDWAAPTDGVHTVLGYAGGESSFKKGRVMPSDGERHRVRDMQHGAVWFQGLEARPGMSGGGFFDDEGRLVGIHRARHDRTIECHAVSFKHIVDQLACMGYEVISSRLPGQIITSVPAQAGDQCAFCDRTEKTETFFLQLEEDMSTSCRTGKFLLCAKCFLLAQEDKWGRKTLKCYEQGAPEGRRRATFPIEGFNFPLTQLQRRLISHALSCYMKILEETLEIVEEEEGSVIVTVELNEEDARRLREAIRNKDQAFLEFLDMFAKPKSESDAIDRARKLWKTAVSLREAGDVENASDYLLFALELVRTTNDLKTQADICCNIGGTYDSLGMSRKAVDYHFRALEIERKLGNEESIAFHLANLGASYFRINERVKAKALLLESKAMYQQLGITSNDAYINWFLDQL